MTALSKPFQVPLDRGGARLENIVLKHAFDELRRTTTLTPARTAPKQN